MYSLPKEPLEETERLTSSQDEVLSHLIIVPLEETDSLTSSEDEVLSHLIII
jgi:hypothetical protein